MVTSDRQWLAVLVRKNSNPLLSSHRFYSLNAKIILIITSFDNNWLEWTSRCRTLSPILSSYTVIRFVSISAKFGICTVVGLNETLVEATIRTWDPWMCVFYIQNVTHLGTRRCKCEIETKRITVYWQAQSEFTKKSARDATYIGTRTISKLIMYSSHISRVRRVHCRLLSKGFWMIFAGSGLD